MAEKVRTFVRGTGSNRSARLVRNEREAVQARWDGYTEQKARESSGAKKTAAKKTTTASEAKAPAQS